MKKLSLILSSVLLVFLVGCNTVPPVDYTLTQVPSVDRKDVELVSVTVGYVPKTRNNTIQTNHLVPPAWKEALLDAFNRSLIFSDDQERKISISVKIDEYDLPIAGFAMTTTCGAIYEVMDRSNGEIVFNERIGSSGTVPMDFAFAGIIRASESINRCGRNNIYEFINKLDSSNL